MTYYEIFYGVLGFQGFQGFNIGSTSFIRKFLLLCVFNILIVGNLINFSTGSPNLFSLYGIANLIGSSLISTELIAIQILN